MKRALLLLAAALALVFFLYAVLSGLVNQGHSLPSAGIVVGTLALGVFGLFWVVRR